MNYTILPPLDHQLLLREIFPQTEVHAIRACTVKEIISVYNLLKLPFLIKAILFFNIPPGFCGAIHIDREIEETYINPDFALNIPIRNCDSTYMNWFDQKENSVAQVMPGPTKGAAAPMLRKEDAIFLDSCCSSNNTIVDISKWHSINNNSDKFSSIISIRFTNTLQKSDVIQALM